MASRVDRRYMPGSPDGDTVCPEAGDFVERKAGRRRLLPKAERGRLTAAERRQVLEQAGHRCLRCGSADDLQVDHVRPISRGGTNTIENRQILCRSCNRWKGARWIDFRPGAE